MEIEVIRSKRKTLSLTVTREGKAVVRAPLTVGEKEIEDFVRRHETWLKRRIAERTKSKPDFTDGSFLCIEGRERLVATGKTALRGDTVFLPAEKREEALIKLLRSLARTRMTALTEEIASRFGFRYSGISIGSARGRWGSCSSKGKITYSFRTAFLPDDVARYLAAHELAHTREFNHSPAFWREVEAVVPNARSYRKELKNYLWALSIL